MRTGELNYQEAREALEQLYESSDEGRRFVLRLYVLYAFNDEYGRKGIMCPEDSEDYLFFAENCREMIKMEKIEGTLKAELYREIGEFDKCIECLDSLEPAKEYENKVRSQIRLMAENKQKEVFLLNK